MVFREANYNNLIKNEEKNKNELNLISSGRPFLIPCSFCKRVFLPASLNKHSQKCNEMSNKMNKNNNKLSEESIEKIVMISKEDILNKRRQRRLIWKKQHEDFKTAIRINKDVVTTASNKLPLPPPPSYIFSELLHNLDHCVKIKSEKKEAESETKDHKFTNSDENPYLKCSLPSRSMSCLPINKYNLKKLSDNNVIYRRQNNVRKSLTVSELEENNKKNRILSLNDIRKNAEALDYYQSKNQVTKSKTLSKRYLSNDHLNLIHSSKYQIQQTKTSENFENKNSSENLNNNRIFRTSFYLKRITPFQFKVEDNVKYQSNKRGNISECLHKPFSFGKSLKQEYKNFKEIHKRIFNSNEKTISKNSINVAKSNNNTQEEYVQVRHPSNNIDSQTSQENKAISSKKYIKSKEMFKKTVSHDQVESTSQIIPNNAESDIYFKLYSSVCKESIHFIDSCTDINSNSKSSDIHEHSEVLCDHLNSLEDCLKEKSSEKICLKGMPIIEKVSLYDYQNNIKCCTNMVAELKESTHNCLALGHNFSCPEARFCCFCGFKR